jgi:hypothetical protein
MEVTMARMEGASRRSGGPRRAGYLLAIGFSAALLVVLNGWPGWQAMPFLTSDAGQVLWLVNLSLAAGITANVVYLAYDPPWVRSLGDLVTTGIGLAAAIRIWQVFPFALSSGWSTAVRVLLVVAVGWAQGRAMRCERATSGVVRDQRCSLAVDCAGQADGRG